MFVPEASAVQESLKPSILNNRLEILQDLSSQLITILSAFVRFTCFFYVAHSVLFAGARGKEAALRHSEEIKNRLWPANLEVGLFKDGVCVKHDGVDPRHLLEEHHGDSN